MGEIYNEGKLYAFIGRKGEVWRERERPEVKRRNEMNNNGSRTGREKGVGVKDTGRRGDLKTKQAVLKLEMSENRLYS